MKHYLTFTSVLGAITLTEEDGALTALDFSSADDFEKTQTPFLLDVKKQLDEYFEGKRRIFSIPLVLHGTEFQKRVWKALETIEYGTVISYQELAEMVGNNKASRAVGGANNKNPIPIIIPCHRVIGKNGKLVGYGGGLWIKEKLLNLERGV